MHVQSVQSNVLLGFFFTLLKLPNETNRTEIKLVTFADDMTTFVRDKPSHLTLINVIHLFGTYSGLKINYEKTEALLLCNK